MATEGNHGPAAIRRVRPVVPRASWVLLTAVSIVGMLNGLYVLLVPVGGQTELAGRTWEQFAAQDQEVASIYAMDLALLGIIWTAFSLLAAIISIVPYRRSERWAWYALWLVPITYGGAATRMLMDRYDAGFWVAGYTAIAVVSLVVAIPQVVRRPVA